MNNVSIIVAIDLNRAIGRDNAIPWHLSSDLKYFKEKTMGKPIVMGRKTFESLGYRQLPGRKNIVVSKDVSLTDKYGVKVVKSIPDALATCWSDPEVMFIGGGQIYSEAIKFATKLYITKVQTKVEAAEIFFPDYSADFILENEEYHSKTDKDDFDCIFSIYTRIHS